eukprot:3483162-Rhodomonas_salina.1
MPFLAARTERCYLPTPALCDARHCSAQRAHCHTVYVVRVVRRAHGVLNVCSGCGGRCARGVANRPDAFSALRRLPLPQQSPRTPPLPCSSLRLAPCSSFLLVAPRSSLLLVVILGVSDARAPALPQVSGLESLFAWILPLGGLAFALP